MNPVSGWKVSCLYFLFLKSKDFEPKSNLEYLASIWATNNLASVVISDRFNTTTKPHLYEKWGLDIQSMATLGYELFFSLLYRLRKLPKTLFIFTYNSTDFPVINLFAVPVIKHRTFWMLF